MEMLRDNPEDVRVLYIYPKKSGSSTLAEPDMMPFLGNQLLLVWRQGGFVCFLGR